MKRSTFIKSLAILPLSAYAMQLNELKKISDQFSDSSLMPVWFIGHGNPMNAILDNPFTRTLNKIGQELKEKPQAILVISAHWLSMNKTYVAVSKNPETIYDFGGFPEEMYRIKYPAPGAPDFARKLKDTIKSIQVEEDEEWGLDHGAWTILKHIFPLADIPVFEMSVDYGKAPEFHFNLAKELKSLRKKGVLIIGSGNIVHNLGRVDFSGNLKPYDWALEFDELVKTKIEKREFMDLVNYQKIGQAAMLSIPTNDHYLPMIYSLGLADTHEDIRFTYEEIQNASISMRCFEIGKI